MDLKHTVLYADDDLDDIMLVKDIFQNHSRNVDLVTVKNGAEAISFLNSLSPDDPSPCLVILDINMPVMDGKETLIELRNMRRFKEVPVIMFTTSSLPNDKDFASKYNADFLTKPINYKQMDLIADVFIDNCAEEVKKKIRKEPKK